MAGNNGEDGAQGEAGEKGETGAEGDKGATGEPGAPGEAGEPGEEGPVGPPGSVRIIDFLLSSFLLPLFNQNSKLKISAVSPARSLSYPTCQAKVQICKD